MANLTVIYVVLCRDCGQILHTNDLRKAHEMAQGHATTPRRGQMHHNVTVKESPHA